MKTVPFPSVLSHIVDNRGKTCPTSPSGIPLIATNCIRNDQLYPVYESVRHISRDTYETWFRGHPEPGDIIFVTKGSQGRVAWVPDPVDFCIAQDMVAVRPNTRKIDPKYLFAVLRSDFVQRQISGMHVGTMIPHFKKGDFGKLDIPLLDRSIQEALGRTYWDLSYKIDLNRRMNETLESMARALYKSWFVDFDPVAAKAAGKRPFGMDDATAAFFPDRFVDSELGPIPERWEAATLGDHFRITLGQSPPGHMYNEEKHGLPFYQGRRDFGDRYPSRRIYCSAPKRMAEAADTSHCESSCWRHKHGVREVRDWSGSRCSSP